MARMKRLSPGDPPRAKKSAQKAATKRSFLQGTPQYIRARIPELKNEDVSLGTTVTADTCHISGTVQGITEGPGDNERIGRKISLTSYRAKLHFVYSAVVQAQSVNHKPPTVRVMLILDRSPNGVGTPTAAQMFTSDNLNALMNLDNDSRFKNLFDRTFVMQGNVTTVWNTTNYIDSYYYSGELDVYVPLKGLVTKFLANTGAATDVGENNLALVVISDQAVTYTGLGRTRYYDA